ncbi:MAG: hypothetical protein ACREBU_08355 [Nitrososphaera sp.]
MEASSSWCVAMEPKISEETAQVARNLYLSGISEEFIAMQLDIEIPVVIQVLKDLNVYREA